MCYQRKRHQAARAALFNVSANAQNYDDKLGASTRYKVDKTFNGRKARYASR